MKFVKPIIICLFPITYSQIICEPDTEDATCLACSNIPQDLEGLDLFDFTPYSPVVKLKLKLEKDDPASDEDLVELEVEDRLKTTIRQLTELEELFLVRFNGLINNRILKQSSSLQQVNLIKTSISYLPSNLLKTVVKSCEFMDSDIFRHRFIFKIFKICIMNLSIFIQNRLLEFYSQTCHFQTSHTVGSKILVRPQFGNF